MEFDCSSVKREGGGGSGGGGKRPRDNGPTPPAGGSPAKKGKREDSPRCISISWLYSRSHSLVLQLLWLLSCDGGCDPDDPLLADVTIGGARYQKAQMGYHSLVVQGGYKTPRGREQLLTLPGAGEKWLEDDQRSSATQRSPTLCPGPTVPSQEWSRSRRLLLLPLV